LLVGCARLDLPRCAVRCSTTACPDGRACRADGYCHAADDPGACGAVDAGPTQGSPLEVSQVMLGDQHACAVDLLDQGWCWGANDRGQLGLQTVTPFEAYARAARLQSGIVDQLIVGDGFSCEQVSAHVLCWGDDRYQQLGATTSLPDEQSAQPIPSFVDTQRRVISVVAGSRHVCATAELAPMPGLFGVYCWGDDSHGQASGRGGTVSSTTVSSVPEQSVVPPQDLLLLAAGARFTCVERQGTTRDVVCWGDDSQGQITDTMSSELRPPTVRFDHGCDTLVAGGSSVACLAGGLLEVRGRLAGDRPSVSGVALGETVGCYVEIGTHEARCWGDGTSPIFGPSPPGVSIPLAAAATVRTGVERMWLGEGYACALEVQSHQLECWGRPGGSGRLGNGQLGAGYVPPGPVFTDARDE
jgi:hypothetical protein